MHLTENEFTENIKNSKFKTKRINNPYNKWENGLNTVLKDLHIADKHEKIFTIISY
jgi:hypothetical protein